jgi:hypothetical protein
MPQGNQKVAPSERRKAVWNILLLIFSAVLARVITSFEDAAAASVKWHRLIFPHLGPFSGLAFVFITGILPGIPFAFVAWRTLGLARSFGASYRIGIGFLVVVLGVMSFEDLAWLLWFGVSVLHTGGRL